MSSFPETTAHTSMPLSWSDSANSGSEQDHHDTDDFCTCTHLSDFAEMNKKIVLCHEFIRYRYETDAIVVNRQIGISAFSFE